MQQCQPVASLGYDRVGVISSVSLSRAVSREDEVEARFACPWRRVTWTVDILYAVIGLILASLGTLLVLNLCMGKRLLRSRLTRLYSTAGPQFAQAMSAVMRPALVSGNRIRGLLNGDDIFAAMLRALRESTARRGAACRSICCSTGSAETWTQSPWPPCSRPALATRRYNPRRWFSLHRMNNRTH